MSVSKYFKTMKANESEWLEAHRTFADACFGLQIFLRSCNGASAGQCCVAQKTAPVVHP